MKSSKFDIFRDWITILFIFLLSTKFTKCSVDTEVDLVLLTEDGQEFKTNGTSCPFGSYFYREPRHIDCVCSRGLWVFYQYACGRPIFIQGSENTMCTVIDFEVQKSLLISDTVEPSLTAIHEKHGISFKIFENSMSIPFSLLDDELIIASGEWTLLFNDGKTACLGKSNQFCIYTADQLNGEEVDSVFEDCHEFKNHPNLQIEPHYCSNFLMGKIKDSDTCMNDRRAKRSSESRFGAKQGRHAATGRAYLPAILAMNPEFVANLINGSSHNGTLPVVDEDEENVTRDGNPIIKSQIWNYLTERATEILQLYDTEPKPKIIKVPVFRFLEIAKEIIQIRCPEHYVPKTHFDMAVSAFRAIQLRDLLYNEEPMSHEEVERIMKVLYDCKNNTNESFPFIQFNRTCNESNPLGPGEVVTEDPFASIGLFNMFEQEVQLDVSYQADPDHREPIIDTVWNVFLHAHSYCYSYFNRSAYNDHHKFSTVMMSLFTNGILHLWTEVKDLSPDIYSGFLGNARVLMQRVVHCAGSARLENTTYPWDLVRPAPANVSVENNDTNTTPAPATRRKRQVPKYESPLDLQAQQGCLGSIRENAFVCKE